MSRGKVIRLAGKQVLVASESAEQRALIKWCKVKGHPFDRVFHIPNGGSRRPIEARIFKGEGVRSAVPDLFLPLPRYPYHGLFLEMKAKNGRLRPDQAVELNALAACDYYCVVAYGWEQASAIMELYVHNADSLPPMAHFGGTL